MDVEKLDASYDRAVALTWKVRNFARRAYNKIALILFFPFVICLAGLVVWLVYELITNPATRHQVGQAELRQLKWYLIFGAVGWVISKIWRKPKETDSGEEPSVHGGKQKDRRKNNRRVQRGR